MKSAVVDFGPATEVMGKRRFTFMPIRNRLVMGDFHINTAGAFYDRGVGQFILPYDVTRSSSDPDALVLGFLQETYVAAAELASWDRRALERPRVRQPQALN